MPADLEIHSRGHELEENRRSADPGIWKQIVKRGKADCVLFIVRVREVSIPMCEVAEKSREALEQQV